MRDEIESDVSHSQLIDYGGFRHYYFLGLSSMTNKHIWRQQGGRSNNRHINTIVTTFFLFSISQNQKQSLTNPKYLCLDKYCFAKTMKP